MSTTTGCRIVGPYFPVGDTDWECRTHDVLAELIDPARAGAPDIRKAEMFCPVGEMEKVPPTDPRFFCWCGAFRNLEKDDPQRGCSANLWHDPNASNLTAPKED